MAEHEHPNDGVFVVVYKHDGDDLNISQRIIGPFYTFEAAYDYACQLPAPVRNGHKYIEPVEEQVDPVDLSTHVPEGVTRH